MYPSDKELRDITRNSKAVEPLGISSAFRVRGQKPGPHSIILGAVHGDERCGYEAIRTLLAEFAQGTLVLGAGELLLVVGNEAALVQGVRFVERNLNRLFRPPSGPATCYEEQRATELMPLIRGSQFMLDLHATSMASPPFLMAEEGTLAQATRIGADRIVYGWSSLGSTVLSGDSESFAASCGCLGFTVENGQKDWEGGAKSAYEMSRRFLAFTEQLPLPAELRGPERSEVYRLFDVQIKQRDGFRYTRTFSSFDRVEAGEEIGRDEVERFVAPKTCFLVMPTAAERTAVGEELYLMAELQ